MISPEKFLLNNRPFIRAIVDGNDQIEAFRILRKARGHDVKALDIHNIRNNACRLMRDPRILSEINRLIDLRTKNQGNYDKSITREEIIEGLLKIINDEDTPPASMIQAWTTIARMKGYLNQKIDVNHSGVQFKIVSYLEAKKENVIDTTAVQIQPTAISGPDISRNRIWDQADNDGVA